MRSSRVNQLYRAQSLINDAVARATDFKVLCEQVCRIGVKEGGIACVLVRLHDAATDMLLPIAFNGPHTGFIGRPQLPAHDSQGVSAIAFQTKQRVVIDDMLVSPITAHVASEVAKQLHINSAAAFPLISAGKPIGTFAMFAEGTGFFDTDLADLLEQTAAILAFSHEKLQTEAARLKAEERLRLAMSASQSGVWDWDLKTGTSVLSDEYYRMFGYEPGESEGNIDFLMSLIPPENREKTLASLKAQWSSGVARTDYEQRFLCKDGSLKWVQIRATIIRAADGTAERMVGTTIDLTERKERERRILQLSRLNAALGKINAAVARVKDFPSLAADACKIAVEDGGFVSAVIRTLDADKAHLTQVADYGARGGFLGLGTIAIAESRGVTTLAYHQREPIVIRDLKSHPVTRHAAADGQRLGINAGAAFPLPVGGVPIGTMTVWAANERFIDGQNLDLLQQIADAVAFAHAKLVADAALIARERDMKLAQQAGNIGSVIIDLEVGRWTTSEVGFTVLGLPPADWYPLATFEALLVPEERARQIATIRTNIASGKPRRPDYEIIRPADGARRWLRLITKSEFDSTGKAVRRIGTLQDVTEEHVAKDQIDRANRLYAALSKTNEAVARSSDFETLAGRVCAIAVEKGGMATAAVRLYDNTANVLRRIAHAGLRFGTIGSEALPMEPLDGLAVDAFRHHHPVQVSDLNQVQSPLGREAAKAGLTAAVSYPLHDSMDQSIGTFTLFASDVQAFDGETARLLQEIAAALSFAWTKYQADAALVSSRRDLELAQESGRIGSAIFDLRDGTYTCSPVTCQIVGLTEPGPHAVSALLQMLSAASRKQALDNLSKYRHTTDSSDHIYEIEHQLDHQPRWIRLILAGERDPTGEVRRRIGTVQDVTRQQLSERRANLLARLYAALSETNAAIVHAASFAALCRAVCKTVVERGGLVSAAIRLLDDDRKRLVETATCGPRAGLLARAEIPVDDTRGVAVNAFRSGKAFVVPNLADDPRTEESSAAAAEIGITSAAAFPLIVQGEVFGVFSVWASGSEWLDDQMSTLLVEISEAVSFARAKLDADARLASSARDLLMAQRGGRIGSITYDMRSSLWTVSQVAEDIMGLPSTGPHDMGTFERLLNPADREQTLAQIREAAQAGIPRKLEFGILRPSDGQSCQVRTSMFTDTGPDCSTPRRIGTIQDITEEHLSARRIRSLSQLYSALSKTNAAVVRSENYEVLAEDICHIVVKEGELISAVVRLYAPESQELVEVAAHGPRTGSLGRRAVPVNDPHGLAVLAFRHGRRVIVTNLDDHPSTRHSQYDARADGIVAGAAFPLRLGDESIGTLTVFAGHAEAFDDRMADLIGEIADSLAFARAKITSEQAQRDADARMSAVIDSAMDAIITCDEGLRIVVFNDAAQRMFRIAAADASGQSLNQLIPERFRAEHPRWMHSFGRHPSGSRAMGRLAQVSALRSDGSEFPVEASISHTELSGKHLYTVIMRDVTAKLANQRALAEAERRYRSLVETSLNGVMILRSDVVAYANPATASILGFKDAVEVTGLSVYPLTVPQHVDAVRREIGRLMRRPGGTLSPQLLRLQRRDGRLIETQATATSLDVEGETLIQLELRDVTRERRALAELSALADSLEAKVEERTNQLSHANNELAAANRDLESFSYSVAHDLRAPLRAMVGFSRLLEMDLEEGTFDQLPSHTKRISDSAKRMNELIDGLLAVARVTHGALTETEIDCNVLVAEVIASLAVPESVQLALENLPVMKGDVPSMRQVWVNLISNAVKYSAKRPQPRIEVGVVRTETEYWFHVRDNGAGFDAAYADRLFGVFQRLHTQDQFEGTGVGLAIVRRIVERHGGRVWAEGRPNEGATFYFALPHTRLIDA